ncbi:MAG: hypothetical protein V9H69_11980 [Anaerolineae bacterium]|jgi:hypothetical protein
MKHPVVLALLALLLSATTVAGASAPPGPFSTTGYTTAFQFTSLPSGYLQFHIQARGGPAYDDHALCLSMYGAPCEQLCAAAGGPCGVHGAFEGSFDFDEVGMGELSSLSGVNAGRLALLTDRGAAELHFGGQAASSGVSGNFAFLGGTENLQRLAGVGAYAGSIGAIFRVDYQPCGRPDQAACPRAQCVVRGAELRLLRSKALWTLANEGSQAARLESLLLHWPPQNGALTAVYLGDQLLASGYWPASWVELDLGAASLASRELHAGKSSALTLEFERRGIDQTPASYSFLARFAPGCSAIHVLFPE